MTRSSLYLEHLEKEVCSIIVRAGDVLTKEWQRSKRVKYKQDVDPVTQFDVEIENEVRSALAALLPAAGFLVEEGQTETADKLNWVIDPIDQTKNFVGLVPLFYIQVALLDEGVPVLGVIYHPVSRQLFSASKGNGTALNGLRHGSLAKKRLDQAIVDIDFGGPSDSLAWRVCVIERLAQAAFRVRMSAGAYAPYIFTGGIDLFMVVNETTKFVDQAPRMIIMREGGLVFEEHRIDGHRILVAGYPEVVYDALEAIRHPGC